MQVGTIIRKYRKDKNLTQEEVANRLVEEITKKLESESIDEVFQWMKQRLMEYPNCYYLTLCLTRIFDSQRQMIGLPQEEKYDAYILDSYTRVLECDDVEMKDAAAESLYYFYMNKEQYEQAEQYLTYFSQENPERKRKQAMICSKTGRKDEAYKAYEELLYGEYQSLNKTFHNIYILALEENDYDKAHMLVDKIQELAHLFEFGEYHEISPALELATLEKNETETLHIMERMLTNLESIGAFTKSSLYSHMTFKAISEESLTEVRQGLIKGFCDGGTYAYLKENQRWRELVGGGGKQDS